MSTIRAISKGTAKCKGCLGRVTYRVTTWHNKDCPEIFNSIFGGEESKAASSNSAPILAADASHFDSAAIVAALSVDLPAAPAGETLEGDVQWMPPGKHNIVASRNGKPHKARMDVKPEHADVIQGVFEGLHARWQAGEGDRPFFDFNHEDRDASAHPTGFYWGGDDPKQGGIRAKVIYTEAGKAGVKGRSWTRFSPVFYTDDKGNVVAGDSVNLGGFVNRAAFQRIQDLRAKAATDADDAPTAEETTTQKSKEEQPTMKSLLAILAKHGVIPSSEVDEASATSSVAQYLETQKGVKTQLDQLTEKLRTTNDSLVKAKKAHAKSAVAAAVKAKRLPPQNEALHAKWEALIEADPANEELLPEAVAVDTGRTVDVQTGDDPGATQAKASGAEAAAGATHPFMAKATEIGHARKLDTAEAFAVAARENPKLYDDYRAKL